MVEMICQRCALYSVAEIAPRVCNSSSCRSRSDTNTPGFELSPAVRQPAPRLISRSANSTPAAVMGSPKYSNHPKGMPARLNAK
jgi:hypothetical protein